MQSAKKLFLKNGYVKTSTQNIIEEAGISKGLLYYYFKSKEDILLEIIYSETNTVLKELKEIAYDKSLNAKQKINTVFNASIRYENIDTEYYKLYSELIKPENYNIFTLVMRYTIKEFSMIFSHMITLGNNEGLFNVKSPYETSLILFSAIFMLNDRDVTASDEEAYKYIEVFKDIITKVLSPKEPIF